MIILKNQEIRGHLHDLVDHFMGLDKESHYMRFFNFRTEEMIRDWINQITNSKKIDCIWILEKLDNRIIAVGQIIIDEDMIAEFAISVSKDMQNKGIGTEMVKKMIEISKDKATKIELGYISSNHKAARIAQKFDFEFISNGTKYQCIKNLEN